jgi:hypothetical protein
MILNTLEERKSGWSINQYKYNTIVRGRTTQDIRDDKLTKIGI